MTSNSTAPFSAYERYRAGWLNPEIIDTDLSSVLLMDTHIKNKAVMIPLRYDNNTPPNIVEYFLIENFHTRNDYATANPFLRRQIFDHTLRKGLIVFHIEDEDLYLPANSNLDIDCADGLWQWNLSTGQATPCDRCDDNIFPDIPSPNLTSGVFDERDVIYIQVGTCLNEYWATKTVGACLGWYKKDATVGDNEDFFREGETDVFSRWSNPSTIRADLQIADKGFEIASYDASTKEYMLKVMVTYNGVMGLTPSKPQDPQLSSNSGQYGNIRFSWAANQEPDLAGYEVSRKVDLYGGVWEVVAQLVTSTYWIDPEFLYAPEGGDFRPTYRVRARDTQGLYSTNSDEVTVRAEVARKIAERDRALPRMVTVAQSFPNPFNPTTDVRYELPEPARVSLTVYDVLGRVVETLVEETKEAGYHTVHWNAAGRSSGVYLARFTATTATGSMALQRTMKLVLTK